MRLTPENMLRDAREKNPESRFALRKYPAADGGGVLGVFSDKAGGFVPIAVETGKNTGIWEKLPGYLTIDGVAPETGPEYWQE